jgi:hypothetical protein
MKENPQTRCVCLFGKCIEFKFNDREILTILAQSHPNKGLSYLSDTLMMQSVILHPHTIKDIHQDVPFDCG